jgi:hypothetical protein
VSRAKPPAKKITEARDAARRHHRTTGEKRAVAPRPLVTPTKKRPAGETTLTWNLELEKTPTAPSSRTRPTRPENVRVGTRKPQAARSASRAASAKKD